MNPCHSCGMPLDEKTVSKHDSKYCIYCQNQETSELKTYDQVREGSVGAAMRLMGIPKEKAEKKVQEPGKIRQEIASWEKILKEKPFYRDVLLRLALFNFQIYEEEKKNVKIISSNVIYKIIEDFEKWLVEEKVQKIDFEKL